MVALNKDFIAKLNSPFMETWQAIAPDAMASLEAGDDEGNANECMVEMVLDADRMAMFAGEEGKAADKLVDEAIKEHGYQKVFAYICKNFQLV